ncbi:MAG: hypothetical protein EOP17_09540, partial [Rhizobiaceae bacterium]
MKKLISIVIVASFTCLYQSSPARADGAVTELFQKYLANGRLGEADEQMLSTAAAAPNNADAQLGLGLLRSARAFEKLSQSLYRYGFGSKSDGYEMFLGRGSGEIARNENPEAITYDQFRGILAAFIEDLDAADKALAAVGEK